MLAKDFRFPLPYALTRVHLPELDKYHVAWKLDGERAMLWAKTNQLFLVFRNGVTQPIDFLDASFYLSEFRLDGEVLYQGDGTMDWYGFDFVDAQNALGYSDRLVILQKCIRILKNKTVGLRIHEKPIVPFAQAGELVLTKPVGVKSDGLIFTRTDFPYFVHASQKCKAVLKWKPAEHQTIDFYLEKLKGNRYAISCQGKDGLVQVGVLTDATEVSPDGLSAGASAVPLRRKNGIYECAYSCANSQWEIVRARPDKTRPNFITVAFHTLTVAIENITFEEILNTIK